MSSPENRPGDPGRNDACRRAELAAHRARRLAQARDPATSPNVLKSLANRDDPALDELLVLNPNTPSGVLKKLFLKHPLAILANPILSLRRFSEAKSLRELLSPSLKLALYSGLAKAGRRPEADSHFPTQERKGWLQNNIELEILNQSQLARICECLAADPVEEVRYELVGRVPVEGLSYFAADPSVRVRAKLAGVTRHHCSVRGWRTPEGHSVLSLELKQQLALDPEESVRRELAMNLELGPVVYEVLSRDPSVSVRCALAAAEHAGIQPGVWRVLAVSSPEVALAVAANSMCPETLRLELADHADAAVRERAWFVMNLEALLAQEQFLTSVDRILRDSGREGDAVALAGNRNIPEPVFNRLVCSTPPVTRRLAKSLPKGDKRLTQLVIHKDETTAVFALENTKGCSKALARRLWARGIKTVRVTLAGLAGPGPASLRTSMATDPDVDVRQATLQYLQGEVPTHVSRGISESLALLARDPETRIRAVVARDHRIDDSVIAELGRDTAPEVRQTVLDFHQLKVSTDLGLLDEPEPASRLKAANTLLSKEWWGNTSASRLASEKAARDSDPAVRLVTAKSAHATCVALSLLIDDPDPQVQQALAERPMFRSWCKTARLNAGIGLRSRRAALAAATSGNPALRAMAAGMTGAGTRSLKDLSRDVSWFVRHTVAGHPKVESTVLASLAEDPHPLVRARAQSRIAKP